MKISVYGAGYVGLVTAACLANLGHDVWCVDIDQNKIASLRSGECPIFECDLPELLQRGINAKKLYFTDCLIDTITRAEIHILATGTPSLPNGSVDLSQVLAVGCAIAKEVIINGVIVIKSTVPVGFGDSLQREVDEIMLQRANPTPLSVASNPEFLREGTAVLDFLNADRIVIGGDKDAISSLLTMYEPLVRKGIPILTMSRRSAELSKYAANALLACKISFINQISQLSECLEADIDDIRQVMALDYRIGPHFLKAGIGYGGSCFPKDVQALKYIAQHNCLDSQLLDAIESINIQQKQWVIKKLLKHFSNNLNGLTVGIWGLSFKPDTDDLREASSLVAINELLHFDLKLRIYDPVSISKAKSLIKDNNKIIWCDDAVSVFNVALDALIIMTEWDEFQNFPLDLLKSKLQDAPLLDGRNCYDLKEVKQNQITYYSVGRKVIESSSEIGVLNAN